MNFLGHLFSAMHSEHCGYMHSRELLKLLPREGAIFPHENAGGIKIGDHAVLFKIESHNHPCAVEPFNGAATGVGGIVRDVLAMNARPIALCNSLKFGDNKQIIEGVTEGISAYGNCIGVPNISTEVLYHPCFTENPLVNVTCIGLAKFDEVLTSDKARPGQKLLLIGSPTGRDGLGGAAFASKELVHDKSAIQIANPFMKKRLIEACLEILPHTAACQDCGAAGILSSSSEVAYKSGCGVEIDLSKVHVGCEIAPHEIMLSETQERMLLVVDEVPEEILKKHDIPYSVIGRVIPEKRYIVKGHCDIAVEELVIPPEMPLDFTPHPSACGDHPLPHRGGGIVERYDHTVGARTQFSPDDDPQFNALWLWEENCSLGVYTFSAANAYEGIINAANKLQARGYTPAGITNCLNFANPEIPPTMYEFRQTILQIKQACEHLEIPVCSGNVSFYNRVINTPTFTMLGVNILGSASDLNRN